MRFRPGYPATYLNLGYALKDAGRIGEAVVAWEQVLRLAPDDPSAREELERIAHVTKPVKLGVIPRVVRVETFPRRSGSAYHPGEAREISIVT